mgnify:FL=1
MSSPQQPDNNKKDKTKIVNARVSETLLKALAMAFNNSNKASLTEIITLALEAELTEIENSTDIDFIKLVEWEKKIRDLFDNSIENWLSGDTSSIEAGKALGYIYEYTIDENLLNVFTVPYLKDRKPLKKSKEIMMAINAIDLEGKSTQNAFHELGVFIYKNSTNTNTYIHIKGFGKDNSFKSDVAQYLKQHSQVLAYDHCISDFGGTGALLVRLQPPEEPNFDRVFEGIKQEIYHDIKKYDDFDALLIDKEKQLKITWDKAFSLHESKSKVNTFEDKSLDIGGWSNYLAIKEINKNLDEEFEQFRSQQSIANSKGSTETLKKKKILEAVNTEVNNRGSSCTELVMEDGTRLYMKTATFDKDLNITAKAKSLLGKKVKTSCWDPIGETGKWTRQGYFRNIYEVSKFDDLTEVLNSKRNATIYPPKDNWFKAFEYSSFANTKVIILGQDPYHGEGQADGLSFSISKGMGIPPSLNNIFKELESDDVEFTSPEHGSLVSWAKQGVLLLNSVLTVEKLSPASHANLGWELITDQVIKTLSEKKENLVFIFWGTYANKKKDLVDGNRHLVLCATHPSPFSATKGSSDFGSFEGCNHFSQTNNYLKKHNHQTINWSIPL